MNDNNDTTDPRDPKKFSILRGGKGQDEDPALEWVKQMSAMIPMFMNAKLQEERRKLWRVAYFAAVRAGHDSPESMADSALKQYDARFTP